MDTREDFLNHIPVVTQALEAFRPDFIFISAGFGGHQQDTHSLGLQEADFDQLTQGVMSAAAVSAKHRVVSTLEGGYNPTTLARCITSHLRTLSSPVPLPSRSAQNSESVASVASVAFGRVVKGEVDPEGDQDVHMESRQQTRELDEEDDDN